MGECERAEVVGCGRRHRVSLLLGGRNRRVWRGGRDGGVQLRPRVYRCLGVRRYTNGQRAKHRRRRRDADSRRGAVRRSVPRERYAVGRRHEENQRGGDARAAQRLSAEQRGGARVGLRRKPAEGERMVRD